MMAKPMTLTRLLLLMAALGASLGFSSVSQAQALTPEQLTLQVKRLETYTEKSVIMLNRVDKELTSVKQQLDKVERKIDNRTMIEMLQRIEELSNELSQLNGGLEQKSHDLAGLKKRQRELYIDTDRRLRDLESRTTQQSTASIEIPTLPDVGTPPIDIAVSGDLTQTVDPVPEPPPLPVQDKTSITNTEDFATNVTSSEEQKAYQSAFDTLKEGRYEKAKAELKTFLQNHPTSSFAGNAQYWLGEAHYVTREFKQAIDEFKNVLSNYPTSLKIPDAMLKLGYTYYELKQFDQAKLLLQDLRKRFTKSTAFRLAGKRLERISKEGN
jgi:tol-pal system protein YbgF